MSDRRSDRDKSSRAARGATLFSGKNSKRKKRSRKKSEKPVKRTIYNKARDPEFEKKLISYLSDNGIEVKQYKNRYILRRLRVRMGRLKFNTYKDYLGYIKKNPNELVEVQESLSINVTRFFRNRDTYERVKKEIFPKLAKDNSTIKVWSAGCAVGAEPYSIAMIASDSVPKSTNVSIMATDVKEDLLRTARFGIYSKPYLAEMNPAEIGRYFIETPTGDYKVKPHIKGTVSFKQQDLMKDDFPRNIDMIFCRNVLIYVDRNAQNVILNKFFKSLKPGGILVLGRTETLFGDWRKSVDILSTKHRIYRKKPVGKFEEIGLNDPVNDLMGSTFPNLKKKRKKRSKPTKKKSKKKPDKDPSDRLQELKDFRKTFEARKKAWEERMEKNRKNREERLASLRDRNRRSSTKRGSTTFPSQDGRRKSSFSTSVKNDDGSLSDYRKRLKRLREPTRESRIRQDLDDDKK